MHSAKVANDFSRYTEFGMAVEGWKVDMAGIRERKRKMVDGLVAMHLQKYKESGAELVMGQGRFVVPKTIEVALNGGGTRTLEGAIGDHQHGFRARIDNIPGLLDVRPLTHIEALELGELPEHLVVLGGGYVGVELAQAFRRFGSRVTVIERNAMLVHQEDPDVTAAIEQLFRDEKIDVKTGTTVERVEGQSGQVGAAAHGRGTLEATHLWLPAAALRTPTASGSRKPAWKSTSAGMSKSTTGWRRLRTAFGRGATVPAVRTLRTSPKMIFGSCSPILRAGIARRWAGRCRFVCSPIRSWPASD